LTAGLSPGNYTYEVIYSYGDDQIASAQVSFTVNALVPSEEVPVWILLIVLVVVIVVFISFLFWFFKMRTPSTRSDGGGMENIRDKIDELLKSRK
jgi:ATP-dependent Zn protease